MDATTHCPRCDAPRSSLVRDGFYHRADDSKSIQRIRCKDCGKKFSNATFTKTYRQKRRRINDTIRFGLASNMCPRDIAELVTVNIKTVASRLIWLAEESREKNQRKLETYIEQHGPIQTVQFDDLLTFEHTNCKPLTVPMAVIDGHKQYPILIEKYFPKGSYTVYKSDRGCVVGQGELKKTQFDHLFSVNHSFANARAKINRLNRRTWCTTKRPERLADHIDVYIDVLFDRLERGRKNKRYSDVLG